MPEMTWPQWVRLMTIEDREAYANRAGVARTYLENVLVHRKKEPRIATMKALADASNGAFSYADLVHFFYTENAA